MVKEEQSKNEEKEKEKKYEINQKIIAFNQHEKNWYSAMIIDIKTTEKETKYVVQFSYNDIQEVSSEMIKSLNEINTISFDSQKYKENNERLKRELRRRNMTKEKIDKMFENAKPKPNDDKQESLLKRKQRHNIKSVLREQQMENDLQQKRNNWKTFSAKFKK